MSFEYHDNRSEFWRKHWELAKDYDSYLDTAKPEEKKRWLERKERAVDLTVKQIARLQGFNRELNVLAYCGSWCGDCSRQVPMLLKMAEAAGEKVTVRLIERETSKELMEELRILGALRVPVIVFLTEDFWEVGRFGERLLSIYKSKAAREIGLGVDHGQLSPRSLARETSDWMDIFERMLLMVRLSPPLRRKHND